MFFFLQWKLLAICTNCVGCCCQDNGRIIFCQAVFHYRMASSQFEEEKKIMQPTRAKLCATQNYWLLEYPHTRPNLLTLFYVTWKRKDVSAVYVFDLYYCHALDDVSREVQSIYLYSAMLFVISRFVNVITGSEGARLEVSYYQSILYTTEPCVETLF